MTTFTHLHVHSHYTLRGRCVQDAWGMAWVQVDGVEGWEEGGD